MSKSLASLLSCLDYTRYNVDLFLFSKKGLFLTQVPQEVNILPENESGKDLLHRFRFDLLFLRLLSKLWCSHITELEKKWTTFWRLNRYTYRQNDKMYDVAISYNDGVELYYLIDCIKSSKKIGYNHTSYTNYLTYKPKLDGSYYKHLDYLITVSDQCAVELKKVFPSEASKVRVVENIVKKSTLFSLAGNDDPFTTLVEERNKTIVIVTVAGLYLRKGFDFSAAAVSKLKDEGYKLKWFIIGVGPEEEQVKQIITDNNISDITVFLYEQSNPYKYVKWADIFMLTSHAEGKSIAVEEAKLLEKPILITHYSSAYDQISHNDTGLIAEMYNDSVTTELRKLIKDSTLRTSLSKSLREKCKSNEVENLEKIYQLWG